MSKRSWNIAPLLTGCLMVSLMTGCACTDVRKIPHPDKKNEVADAGDVGGPVQPRILSAVATVKPVGDNKVQGKVTFTRVEDGIRVVADFDGLTPGEHGFHVHEHGSCGGAGASEAGAHFNPTNSEHGAPNKSVRHVGDLGNLVADENGHAHYDRVDRQIRFEGKRSIIGHSVIVHAKADDYTTQPSGNSGDKISCGIIEAISPE